ncbi:germinal-center associated nuclear protein [Anolis sagrei]|uniref:germinal-center associated nuclear protein n=1 Tax=Anolis sagrei TaxID=38937 RepID=UPI003520C3F1
MNPNTPFSGQQPGGFQLPPQPATGMFPAQPSFQFGQPPIFGKNTGSGVLLKNPGFTHLPDFTVTTGVRSSLGLGQTPGFAQSYTAAQTTSFATSAPTYSSVPSKQTFSFKPPTALGPSHTPPNFGATSTETSGSGFVGPDFSFKTPENAIFKPIFGTGSGQEKLANTGNQPSFTFSSPSTSGSGRLAPFAISQAGSSAASTSYSFSKPLSSNTSASSFGVALPSKTTEDDKKRPAVFFASPSSSFTSFSNSSTGSLVDPFQMNKSAKLQHEEIVAPSEPHSLFGKGTKRKEEQEPFPRRHEYDGVDEPELLSKSDHSPNKRPVRLNRPIRGLFDRTLLDVLKSNKKESKMEKVPAESGEMEQAGAVGESQTGFAMARAVVATPRKEESKVKFKEGTASPNPLRRNRNSGSTESLGGLPPNELITFQCKNIPDFLNDRTVLEKHFKKFIDVQRVRTIRNKKLAIVYCYDHASALLARKKAKDLHKDIVTFWHKKKTSPNKKDYPSTEETANESSGRRSSDQLSHQVSIRGKALLRSAGSGNLSTKSSPVKKPGLKKALQFEAYAFDSIPEVHSSENVEVSPASSSSLIGMVAETSEDKYRLLDQRDKIMRQARVKQIDLGKAKTFVGTCPDMCPEKERYMRETRNQLSFFEVIPGTDKVDHAAAVKEYSRSSADQEEPLPHELRPSEVLSMTMDYLVTQIMDKGEGNYREWYDFVWNRTRGIRKDITQQHLCCPLTVSLIEKCTRFHIHCSHHLCEEPMSSFDAKINNENMTKCLQSLKEMYQDLANKGIYCKSEAEFRGYNVLLNLNNGDILREVQQFRPEVRNSAEVRFAVQTFAALNSNNFVRFFKLVQKASYLNACLLHCYFSQIRRDALKSLNVAYTVSTQRATIFPLDNVVRMLLFRHFEDAIDFISYYGLSVSDGFVELNRSAFLEPESLPKPKKSVFVGQKLTVSIGEIVNGGPLQPIIRHVPVCSFNAQNRYTGENAGVDPTTSNQKVNVDVTEPRVEVSTMDSEVVHALPSSLLPPAPLPSTMGSSFQPLTQPLPPPPKPQPVYSDMDIAEVVEDLVHEVLEAESREISNAGAAYVKSAIGISNVATDELMSEVMLEMSSETASIVLNAERERFEDEKRQAEEERQRQEKERFIKTLSESMGTTLTDDVIKEMMQEISTMELKCAREKDQKARIARCSKEVCAEIMGTFLEDEIFQSAKETLQELQCFCKYLQRWRDAVVARKKLKRQMRAFPAAPCYRDPKDVLKALSPSAECPITREHLAKRIVNLGHAGNLGTSYLRLGWLRSNTVHQMKVQHFYQQLLRDTVWTPLDLPSLVAENIPVQQEKVFWKALLVLPSYEEYPAKDPSRILADWLKAKFGIDKNLEDTTSVENDGIKTIALHTSLCTQRDRDIYVSVCIKTTHGTLSTSEVEDPGIQKKLLGTSGLILLLSPRVKSDDVAEEDIYWLSALLQLKRLLQAKPYQPIVPLVVLVPSRGDEAAEKEVEEGLMLPDLISANLISGYKVVEISDSVSDLQGTRKLSEAVQWLVAQYPCSINLCCQTLRQYVEDGLDLLFSQQFYPDMKERYIAGLCAQDPSAIIELYNNAVQFLAEVVSSEDLCDFSWPVIEFAEPGGSKLLPHLQWNMPKHLAWLRKAVLSFQIPHMDLPPSGAPWHLVCAMIFQYVSQTASSPQTQEILQSQMENLLSRTYLKWEKKSVQSSDDGPSVEEIPWDSMLALCINHKLRDWKPPCLPVAPEAVNEDGQIQVYFFKEHLERFSSPFSWEEARLKTQKMSQQSQGRSKIKTSFFAKLHSPSLSPAECWASEGKTRNADLTIPSGADLTVAVSEIDALPERLSIKLQQEKAESRRFEEQLQQLLVEDSEIFQDSPSLPLYLPETLVCVPQIIHPLAKTSMARSPEAGKKELPDPDTSLSHRLQYLKQQIRANKEEEMACEIHLSTLLDVTNM